MSKQATVEVCMTKNLVSLFDFEGKTAVVNDIFRASSCIVTGIAGGLDHMVPVAEPEEASPFRKEGYIAAGERHGLPLEGFDMGNSPVAYKNSNLKGKKVVMTTSNGTKALKACEHAAHVYVGAFLNLEAMADRLRKEQRNVIVVCSGWRGHVNIEDTLYAGALAHYLKPYFKLQGDAAEIAVKLYEEAEEDLDAFLRGTDHYERLKGFGHQDDLDFCLKQDVYDVIPEMSGGEIKAS